MFPWKSEGTKAIKFLIATEEGAGTLTLLELWSSFRRSPHSVAMRWLQWHRGCGPVLCHSASCHSSEVRVVRDGAVSIYCILQSQFSVVAVCHWLNEKTIGRAYERWPAVPCFPEESSAGDRNQTAAGCNSSDVHQTTAHHGVFHLAMSEARGVAGSYQLADG